MEGSPPAQLSNSVQISSEEKQREQEIWSWGAGTDGQLATGKLQDEHEPQLLRSWGFRLITSLACGGAHVIALCQGGRVLTWGRGNSGQLGHGDMVNSLLPKEVRSLESTVIVHVSAGWNHSGFVSEDGAIFTCGEGSFGKLGHGDNKSQCVPLVVSYFEHKKVKEVACGMRHTLVLLGGDIEAPVYAFGSGKHGQLGIYPNKVESTNLPQMTMGLNNLIITNIFANGDHSAALSADGSLYTWGRGFDSASAAYIPHRLDTTLSFTQVALGWNHALLLTDIGLFMLGGDRHGLLGDPRKTSSTHYASGKPKEHILQTVPGLVQMKVQQIAAGSEHSALVTDEGSVITWGWGEHGQLGLGNANNRTVPQMVSLGKKCTENQNCTYRVYCGSGFTFCISSPLHFML